MSAKRYGIFPELPTNAEFFTFGGKSSSDQWLLVGELAEYGRRRLIHFDITKEKVMCIVGRRGQGKSYTLGTVAEGLSTAVNSLVSHIERNRAIILFDPLNVFQWTYVSLENGEDTSTELQNQINLRDKWKIPSVPLNVKVWVPPGYRSPLYPSHYQDLSLGVSDFTLDDWSALTGFDVIRDVKGQYLSELYQKVSLLGWQEYNGIQHQPQKKYNIQDLLECSTNDIDNSLGIYKDDTRRAVRQRLISYSLHPVFSSLGTPLTELLKPGMLSIVLLNKLPEDLRTVFVGVLARRIVSERSEASENTKDLLLNRHMTIEERSIKEKEISKAIPKTWVIIDEVQTIFPSDTKTAATDALIKLIKEGRNFGLSFVAATQQPRAIHPTVMSQCETFFIHKLVSEADIEAVVGNLKSLPPEEIKDESRSLNLQDLIKELPVGYVAVSDVDTSRAFVMEVRPRITAHGGFEA
jgi:hypothetical protein